MAAGANEMAVWDLQVGGKCKHCFRSVLRGKVRRERVKRGEREGCVLFGALSSPTFPFPILKTLQNDANAGPLLTAPLPTLEKVPLPSHHGDPVLQGVDA